MVFSLNRVFLKLQFESKHQPLDWSPWSLEWSQLACQGVLMILGDGWLYYCIGACCVTSSCTQPLHVCLLILGCCLIVCIEGNKYVQKQQNKQNISAIEMLPDDKRWGKSCWPQRWQAQHPAGDGLRVTFCPEDLDHGSQYERRSGSCSFIWLNCWSRAPARSGKKESGGKGATTNKVWPRSRCTPIVSLHAISTILVKLEKTPPVPHKTPEDVWAAGRHMKCR